MSFNGSQHKVSLQSERNWGQIHFDLSDFTSIVQVSLGIRLTEELSAKRRAKLLRPQDWRPKKVMCATFYCLCKTPQAYTTYVFGMQSTGHCNSSILSSEEWFDSKSFKLLQKQSSGRAWLSSVRSCLYMSNAHLVRVHFATRMKFATRD